MEDYLLKSSISLTLLYLLFRIIIYYERNHQLNRFIGFACLLFSCCFMFIPVGSLIFSTDYATTIHIALQGSEEIEKVFQSSIPDSTANTYFIIYIIGVMLFSLRSIAGLATLISFYFTSERYHQWGFMVVCVNKKVSPFTFFNLLFVSGDHLNEDNIDALLVHEQFHRDQLHSVDSLILEVLTIVFWFNPVAWLFRRDIRAEHEYMADQQVIKKGFHMLDYQHLLFKARTGISMQLGNYLSNKTSLTKRFNMMTKRKINTKSSYFRALVFLPLMAFIVAFSSFTEISNSSQVDKQAVYEQGMPTMYKTIGKNIKYPISARKGNSQGIVHVSFTVNSNGEVENIKTEQRAGYLLEEVVVIGYGRNPPSEKAREVNQDIKTEAARVIGLLEKFIPAQKDGEFVSSELTIPIQFKLN
jgi:hypothetical protein